MSTAAAPPMKRKRPFAAPPLPEEETAASDEKVEQEEECGKDDETGKKKARKEEGSGILSSRLFSELPISDRTARAIAEMDYTRLTHVRPLPAPTRKKKNANYSRFSRNSMTALVPLSLSHWFIGWL